MHGQLAISVLEARVLDSQRDARWSMNKRDGSGNLVYVLAARSGRARKDLFELFRAQAETSHPFG
jgi:hypothetical protein